MADVNLTLGVDTDEAEKELREFAQNGSRSLQGIQNSFKALGAVAAGAVAFFAGREIVSGIQSVVDAASVQENAVNQLNTSLQLAGDFSEEASQRVQTFASELQAVTTVGDETTLQLFALAKNFGLTNEETERLTEAAIELSAATGIELESAVRNLGKTTAGLAGELGESIPQIRELSKESLAAGGAIDLVLKRFGGAAASQVNTFSGATQQLANTFGDLQEEIGFVITQNPQVIAAIKEISAVIRELTGEINSNRDDFSGFTSTIINGLVEFGIFVAQSFQVVQSILNDSELGFRIFAQGVINAFNFPLQAIKSFQVGTFEVLRNTATTVTNFVAGLIDTFSKIPGIDNVFGDLSGLRSDVIETGNSIRDSFNGVAEVIEKTPTALDGFAKGARRAVAETILANQESERSTQKVIDRLVQAQTTIADASKQTVNFNQDVQRSGSTAASEITKVGDAAKATQDKIAEGQRNIDAQLQKSLESARIASLSLTDQLPELATALQAAYDAGDATEFARIQKEIEEVNKRITEEYNKQAEAQDELIRKQQEQAKARNDLFDAQQDQILQGIGNAAVGADTTVTVEIDTLQQEIDDLRSNLNSAALTAEDREKAQEDLLKKEEELSNLQDRRNQGALNVISQVGSVVGDILLPGFGGLIGGLLNVLGQGPEAAAAFITGLIQGIPVILVNIVRAIPSIITALIDEFPALITALAVEVPAAIITELVPQLPRIIEELVKLTPRVAEALAQRIGELIFSPDFDLSDAVDQIERAAGDFARNIVVGAGNFITKLVEEVTGAFDFGLGGGGGDGGLAGRIGIGGTGGQVINSIGGALGFGLTGSSGFGPKNSTESAAFEAVLERQSARDEDLISSFTEAISNELRDAFARDNRPLVINLEVGESQLANVLLRLNRNGFRTA